MQSRLQFVDQYLTDPSVLVVGHRVVVGAFAALVQPGMSVAWIFIGIPFVYQNGYSFVSNDINL